MDYLRRQIAGQPEIFKYILLGGAAVAAVNTLSRPDYNIVLYLYVYYVWMMMNDSKVLVYLIP
jgi:hypothetical protein